jgi:hypothetical protein
MGIIKYNLGLKVFQNRRLWVPIPANAAVCDFINIFCFEFDETMYVCMYVCM